MLKKLLLITSIIMLAACGSDSNDPIVDTGYTSFTADGSFSVTLTGDQQVPIISSGDEATATVEYQQSTNIIKISLNAENVEGFSDATLNMGETGEVGPVQLEFPSAGGSSPELFIRINASQLDALLNGMMYINVTSDTYSDGAVRGQILPSDTIVVSFPLSGAQEVPAVTTKASGNAYATYNTGSLALTLRVNTSEVDDATMAHIHTGRVGNNGPVLLGLESSDDGVWKAPAGATLDADTFAILAGGGHYVNVHTPANPGGELRGQILTNDFVLVTFPASGMQEVPAVVSDASGDGYALVNITDYAVELTVVTRGVEDASMAHIHTGRVGENGPVLVALQQSADDVNVWATPPATALTPEIFAVLASGGHYVNVHTPANPGGELRGQILTDNLLLVTFALSGAQEVPAVSTMAGGSGYAIVNTNNYALELKVVTNGVMNATMAHIHTGRVGNNGDVLVALEQSMDDANVWSVPAETALNEEIFEVLASGGHYVNVHTPANPGGELRGQILTDNFALVTFNLSGAQEVPAVATAADGDGYALVNTSDFGIELVALTRGVSDATMAHIHTGNAGMNGPVLVGLERLADQSDIWVTPADLSINEDIFAVLAAGGHYVNVHTPANPSGEIRGQIQ